MRRISAPSGFTGNLLLKPTILLPLASVSRTQNWLITRPPTPRKRNPAPLPRGKTTSLDVTHLILFTANLGEFLARRIEDEFGHVQQLILIGKERGYLLYDEINDSLPTDVHSSQEIDDLLSTLERQGIEIYEDIATANATRAGANAAEGLEVALKEELADEGSLDLSFGVDPKSQDPVRIYLREMGSVPLLTREGEVVIAKRIERGQLVVMKAITRSPIVIKEIIAVGVGLRDGARSIKEIVHFDDEELTEEKIAKKTKQTLRQIEKIAELYKTALKQTEKLAKTLKSKRRSYLRVKWGVARTRIQISLTIRDIPFHWLERKRLIDKMRVAAEGLHAVEREARRLERRVDAALGDVAAEARKELRARRAELKEIEQSSEVG